MIIGKPIQFHETIEEQLVTRAAVVTAIVDETTSAVDLSVFTSDSDPVSRYYNKQRAEVPTADHWTDLPTE